MMQWSLSVEIVSEVPKVRHAASVKEHVGMRVNGAQQSPRAEKDFFDSFFIRKKNIIINILRVNT